MLLSISGKTNQNRCSEILELKRLMGTQEKVIVHHTKIVKLEVGMWHFGVRESIIILGKLITHTVEYERTGELSSPKM